MPNSSASPPPKPSRQYPTNPLIYELAFWCYAWLGAAIAGGCFGFFVGFLGSGLQGLFFGFMFVALTAFPILLTVAIATWSLWLSRFRLITAAIAGAMILFAATKFLELPGLMFSDLTWVFGRINLLEVAASLCGAIASPLFGYLFCRGMIPQKKTNENPRIVWQFTLRELFVHFTILAVLISLWTWLFSYCRDLEKRNQQRQQQIQLHELK